MKVSVDVEVKVDVNVDVPAVIVVTGEFIAARYTASEYVLANPPTQ